MNPSKFRWKLFCNTAYIVIVEFAVLPSNEILSSKADWFLTVHSIPVSNASPLKGDYVYISWFLKSFIWNEVTDWSIVPMNKLFYSTTKLNFDFNYLPILFPTTSLTINVNHSFINFNVILQCYIRLLWLMWCACVVTECVIV